MSKLYRFLLLNHLWLDDPNIIKSIKNLIINGEIILEALTLCLTNINEYIKIQNRIFLKKQWIQLKIENAIIVHKCLTHMKKEMEITKIISVIFIKKRLPQKCVSKNIFCYLKINLCEI